MTTSTRAPRPIFYAVSPLEGDTPRLADRWFAQTGDIWAAVAPSESEADWFEDCEGADIPAQRVRAINDIPESGTLRYCRRSWEECELLASDLR